MLSINEDPDLIAVNCFGTSRQSGRSFRFRFVSAAITNHAWVSSRRSTTPSALKSKACSHSASPSTGTSPKGSPVSSTLPGSGLPTMSSYSFKKPRPSSTIRSLSWVACRSWAGTPQPVSTPTVAAPPSESTRRRVQRLCSERSNPHPLPVPVSGNRNSGARSAQREIRARTAVERQHSNDPKIGIGTPGVPIHRLRYR